MRLTLLHIALCLTLSACTSGASHIPPLHEIPGAALGSLIENRRYEARREKVKAAIRANFDVLTSKANDSGGATFTEVCMVAKIGTAKCHELASQVAQDAQLYKAGTKEGSNTRTGNVKRKLRQASQCNVNAAGNLTSVVRCRSNFLYQSLASFKSRSKPRLSITAFLVV